MRRDDQINQPLQMYVLLLRNKQLFTDNNVDERRSLITNTHCTVGLSQQQHNSASVHALHNAIMHDDDLKCIYTQTFISLFLI